MNKNQIIESLEKVIEELRKPTFVIFSATIKQPKIRIKSKRGRRRKRKMRISKSRQRKIIANMTANSNQFLV